MRAIKSPDELGKGCWEEREGRTRAQATVASKKGVLEGTEYNKLIQSKTPGSKSGVTIRL